MYHILLKTLLYSIFSLIISVKSFSYTTTTLPPNLENPVRYTEETIRFMLSTKKMEPIEGIYRCMSQNPRQSHRIAIFKDGNDNYLVIFLNGASYYMDWQEGAEMGFIPKKAELENQYLYSNLRWYLPNKVLSTQANLAFSGKGKKNLVLSFSDHLDVLVNYTKESLKKNSFYENPSSSIIPPKASTPSEPNLEKNINNRYPNEEGNYLKNMGDAPSHKVNISFGTSFAISKKGDIVTNEHVVRNAKSFKVIQYHNGVAVEYNARLLYADVLNDIAILRIEDPNFQEFEDIPYSICSDVADQGQEVFTLGFPLSHKLGTEMKLGSGLISSPFGYGDYAKAYGTNIELLPGNSGGPLFNDAGNLEGIVYSRFSEYNNTRYTVGYAIRSQILIDVIEKNSLPIQLPSGNKINDLPLTEQVKQLKPFVFHIAAYN